MSEPNSRRSVTHRLVPAVTVVVPCHNAGAFLGDSIASVLEQRCDVTVDVIIVDDRSSDPETLRELRSWNSRSRVRVLASRGRPGPAGARNTGVAEARSEWIAFLDADDIWLPGGLEARLAVLKEEPEAAFISADFGYLFPDGTEDRSGFYRTRPIPRQVLEPAFREQRVLRLERPVEHFLHSVLTFTGVVLIRRELVLDVGAFDEALQRAEDDHLWIRLARRTDLYFVPEVVTLYRQHENSLTKREEAPFRWGVVAFQRLLEDPEFLRYRDLIRRRLAEFGRANAYYHRARAEWADAAREAAGAVRWQPLDPVGWKVLMGALARRP